MNKRYGSILIVSVTILVLCFVAAASATTWTVNGSGVADFTGIQNAINNASDGDTILVYFGIYHENVVVDKSVMLKGIDYPVVDAGREESAITLTADGITLQVFNITNAGSSWCFSTIIPAGINVISNNNTITGNIVCNNNNGYGIHLHSSSNNTITGNNISNNDWDGTNLCYSSNNTITGNNVSNNNRGGISLSYSSNNKIYSNNFINNTDNAYFYTSTTIWNSPFEITYTYDGTTYKSYVGNYWDNYGGTDAEGDGIGDTHYSIDSGSNESDDYPLMQPFENYNITTSHE